MALINCSECNKQISDTALKCIYCGSPIEKKDSNVTDVKKKKSWKKIFTIITLVIIFLCVSIISINRLLHNASVVSSDEDIQINKDIVPEDLFYDYSKIVKIKKVVDKKVYDLNGNILGYFDEEGTKNGKWKGFYQNNSLAYEGIYQNGLMNGFFKHYYENGIPKHQGSYRNGSLNNISKSSGLPISGREGIHKFYYTNGGKDFVAEYNEGRKNGVFKSWHKNGIKKIEENYNNYGYLRGLYIEWDENGQIIKHGYYKQQYGDDQWDEGKFYSSY